MTVKLYPFHLAFVYAGRTEVGRFLNSCQGAYCQLIVKAIDGSHTFDFYKNTLFDLFPECVHLLIFGKKFHADGI